MSAVLARGFGGQPMKRDVISVGKSLVFLANPDRIERNGPDAGGVGFPREDVFEYDEALAVRLQVQWQADRRTDPVLWAHARPYK